METRELYKQKYQAQLHEWSAKIDVMKAQSEKLTAQAKLDMKPHLDAMHDRVEAAKAKLHEVAEATDDKWDEVLEGADHAWHEVTSAVEGALAALKTHTKS